MATTISQKKQGVQPQAQASEAIVRQAAEHSLHHFKETADGAREALGEQRPTPNTFAVVNTLTNEAAVRNLAALSEDRAKELRRLCSEPAIARVVAEDESGNKRTYFVASATHRTPRDGSAVASYRAPMGRLASIPVGEDVDISEKGSVRTFTVLERMLLHPRETGEGWDSVNSVFEGETFGPLTISSFRQLLLTSGVSEDAVDELEAALAVDKAQAVIIEGLKRDAIIKMELRELAVLDRFQDEIFRLPLDTHLVLLGPPGTGKTTTLIKRLGLKLDLQYLSDDERDTVGMTLAGAARHRESWLMFTPTALLKQYIKEAFAREHIPAPDDRIQTWDDFRRDLARNRFGILRSASGSGQFMMKDGLSSVKASTLRSHTAWFEDFDTWQSKYFWSDLKFHSEALAANERPDIARLGRELLDALPTEPRDLHASTFPQLMALADSVQAIIASLKESTDKAIRASIAQEHRKETNFLNSLAAFVSTIDEIEDADDPDAEEEDEPKFVRMDRNAAVEMLSRAIRAKARAIASGKSLSKQSRSGNLNEWFGERGPSREELKALGDNLQVQASARRFIDPIRRYMDGLSTRYRRFRRARQTEDRWYNTDGFSASDLNPLEVDVILLSILGAARGMLSERRIARDVENGRFAILQTAQNLYRNQIFVDEATDFSPIQLSCMAKLCDPASDSFVACGDFNQRITEWGSRSSSDLAWVFADIETRAVTITYRHSKQLNELARAIALLSTPDVPEAQLPPRVNNEGFKPVLATDLSNRDAISTWLARRIDEIEKLADGLPSVAILVADEEDVIPTAHALNKSLADKHVRVVPCPFGQMAGQDNDVRVFDVRHIKGLEFEAVFFVGIDKLAEMQPDLFEKYLYVGATRAAMYLGITVAGAALPPKIASLEDRFQSRWP